MGSKLRGVGAISALVSLTGLTSLRLWRQGVTVQDALALGSLTALCSLELVEARMHDTEASALASVLTTKLTHLRLRENRVHSAGARAVAALTALVSLDFRALETREIGYSEEWPHEVEHDTIWSNRVGNEGASTFIALSALTYLGLDCNDVGLHGARALATMICLAHLDLAADEEYWTRFQCGGA